MPIFDLREVVVTGNRETAAVDVARAANLRGGAGLLSVSLSSTSRRVCALPWVKAADVRRVFPHGVAIDVTERQPVARLALSGGKCALLGEGGVAVSIGCAGRDAVPTLKGASLTAAEPGARLSDGDVTALLDALHAATLPSSLTVREVNVVDKGRSAELVTTADALVRLGALREAATKIRYLEALCRTVKAEQYEVFDLRLGGEATLVPRVRR